DAKRGDDIVHTLDNLVDWQAKISRPEGDLLPCRRGRARQLGTCLLEEDAAKTGRIARLETGRRLSDETGLAVDPSTRHAGRKTAGDEADRRLAGVIRSD